MVLYYKMSYVPAQLMSTLNNGRTVCCYAIEACDSNWTVKLSGSVSSLLNGNSKARHVHCIAVEYIN